VADSVEQQHVFERVYDYEVWDDGERIKIKNFIYEHSECLERLRVIVEIYVE